MKTAATFLYVCRRAEDKIEELVFRISRIRIFEEDHASWNYT